MQLQEQESYPVATARTRSLCHCDHKNLSPLLLQLQEPAPCAVAEKKNPTEKFCRPKQLGETNFFSVEKSKVANRLKRVFPKFEADRSHVRGVNASSKYIPRKYPPLAPEIFLSANLFNLVKAVRTYVNLGRYQTWVKFFGCTASASVSTSQVLAEI